MSLKDNLQAVKSRLGAEEQMIENFIKGERFFRKYKFIILSLLGIFLIFIIYYYASSAFKSAAVSKNNDLFMSLIDNPTNSENLELLKKNNPNLYVIFLMSLEDSNALQEALNLKLDPLVKEILSANFMADSKFLKEYKLILEAYELLKEGKIEEADLILAQIPLNSELKDLVNNFKHYKGIK